MRRKCLNPGCTEFFTPGKENRGYGGCCSLDCFRIAQRGYSSGAGLALMPVQPSVGAQTHVNRRHGADRKAQTE
jgi:hypothetical protein